MRWSVLFQGTLLGHFLARCSTNHIAEKVIRKYQGRNAGKPAQTLSASTSRVWRSTRLCCSGGAFKSTSRARLHFSLREWRSLPPVIPLTPSLITFNLSVKLKLPILPFGDLLKSNRDGDAFSKAAKKILVLLHISKQRFNGKVGKLPCPQTAKYQRQL